MGTDPRELEIIRERGVDVETTLTQLRQLEIETPSWGYGDSGTRFHVYPWPGAARTVHERIADAALVHTLTGACPSVAIHIPWDRVDDWSELAHFAESQGVRVGAVNPNLFQENAYRLGSLCNPDPAVRRQALDHCLECVEIATAVGSSVVSLWLADGTNYPGQDDLRGRFRHLVTGLHELYAALPDGVRLLVEYKFFEPAFYATDLPDWGTAALVCRRLGPQAQVLVDTGHHALGTNIEQIVALLLEEGLLGGFHFNNRKYADDDLIAGSVDPFELFRIMNEIVAAKLDPSTAHDSGCDRVHDRSVAQRRGQARGDDPVGRQHPDRIRQGAPRRSGAVAQSPARGRRPRRSQSSRRCLRDGRSAAFSWLFERPRIFPLDPIEAFRSSGHAERLARERA